MAFATASVGVKMSKRHVMNHAEQIDENIHSTTAAEAAANE